MHFCIIDFFVSTIVRFPSITCCPSVCLFLRHFTPNISNMCQHCIPNNLFGLDFFARSFRIWFSVYLAENVIELHSLPGYICRCCCCCVHFVRFVFMFDQIELWWRLFHKQGERGQMEKVANRIEIYRIVALGWWWNGILKFSRIKQNMIV